MINLDSPEANGALSVCKIIQGRGAQAWLVGGAVRDSLMGKNAHDYDVATSATPDQICRWFPKVIPTGIKHGTVTVMNDLGHKYEVTTFRADGVYTDGRRPDKVFYSESIEHDLARRDFTINAIAYDPIADRFCDPHNGAMDILRSRLRCVGSPLARFQEDGLRTLRACRFAGRYSLSVDQETKDAIGKSLDSFAKVSPERVTDEWAKMFTFISEYTEYGQPWGDDQGKKFDMMEETGLLWITIPELKPLVGCEQNRYHGYDCWGHTRQALVFEWPVLFMATLLHDVAKPVCKGWSEKHQDFHFIGHEDVGADMAREIMTRMRFPNETTDRVCHLIRHHLLPREEMSYASARRWIRKVGEDCLRDLFRLAYADARAKGPAKVDPGDQWLRNFEAKVQGALAHGKIYPIVHKSSQLAVTGHDVMETLKIGPGKQIGLTLAGLMEYVTEYPERNTREALIEKMLSEPC